MRAPPRRAGAVDPDALRDARRCEPFRRQPDRALRRIRRCGRPDAAAARPGSAGLQPDQRDRLRRLGRHAEQSAPPLPRQRRRQPERRRRHERAGRGVRRQASARARRAGGHGGDARGRSPGAFPAHRAAGPRGGLAGPAGPGGIGRNGRRLPVAGVGHAGRERRLRIRPDRRQLLPQRSMGSGYRTAPALERTRPAAPALFRAAPSGLGTLSAADDRGRDQLFRRRPCRVAARNAGRSRHRAPLRRTGTGRLPLSAGRPARLGRPRPLASQRPVGTSARAKPCRAASAPPMRPASRSGSKRSRIPTRLEPR